MHGWEGRPFADIERLTRKRDPRRFPVGCVTAAGDAEVVQWFRNIPELSQFLRRMEPQRWGLQGPALIDLKTALEPVLTRVDVFGLTEDNRAAHNRVTAEHYAVIWWGSLDELLAATEGWPACLIERAGAAGLPPEAATERLRQHLRDLAGRGDV